MRQMSEAARKRMEKACEKHGDEYQVRETEEWTGNAIFRLKDLDSSFCAGYKAGTQDQDAGASISESDVLEAVTQWKHFWMNQTQNSEADRKNYFDRAFGVDSNMKHDLARRIVQKIREARK